MSILQHRGHGEFERCHLAVRVRSRLPGASQLRGDPCRSPLMCCGSENNRFLENSHTIIHFVVLCRGGAGGSLLTYRHTNRPELHGLKSSASSTCPSPRRSPGRRRPSSPRPRRWRCASWHRPRLVLLPAALGQPPLAAVLAVGDEHHAPVHQGDAPGHQPRPGGVVALQLPPLAGLAHRHHEGWQITISELGAVVW